MITNGSKGKSPSSLRGFSLVELLVVVTIIAILSGLVIGVTGFVQRKAAVDRARVQLNLFSLKIEEYSADVGGLLPEEEDKTGIIIYRMLYGDGIGADGIAGTADDGAMDGRPDDGFSPYIADLDPNTNPQKWIDKEGREVPAPSGSRRRPSCRASPARTRACTCRPTRGTCDHTRRGDGCVDKCR